MKVPKAKWLAIAGGSALLGYLFLVGAVHSDRGWHYVVWGGQPTPELPGSFTISVGNDVRLIVQAYLFTSSLTISTDIENDGATELQLSRRPPRLYDANQVEIPLSGSRGCFKEGQGDTVTLKPDEGCLLDSSFGALGNERSLRQLTFVIDGVTRDQRPVTVSLVLRKWAKGQR